LHRVARAREDIGNAGRGNAAIDGDFDVVFNGSSWNHQHRIVEANGTARQHLPRFESLDHCSTLEGMKDSL